jgi:hypothetical protein
MTSLKAYSVNQIPSYQNIKDKKFKKVINSKSLLYKQLRVLLETLIMCRKFHGPIAGRIGNKV